MNTINNPLISQYFHTGDEWYLTGYKEFERNHYFDDDLCRWFPKSFAPENQNLQGGGI